MRSSPLIEPTTFHPHRRYLLLAGASFGVAALFAWELIRSGVSAEIVLFLVALVLTGLSYTRSALTSVHLTAQQITIAPPMFGRSSIEYRQLVSVSQDGRLFDVIVLIYHPLREDGLLDLDAVRSCNLPAVVDQDVLYDYLKERMAA